MATKQIKFFFLGFISAILVLTSCLIVLKFAFNKEANLYDNCINKIVEVCAWDEENEKNYGTAFFLDKETLCTNCHVVTFKDSGDIYSFENIFIRFADEQDYSKVELLKLDAENDIALLLYKDTHKHSYFKKESKIASGKKCFCIGNYSNYGLSYKEGTISLESIRYNYNNYYSSFIQCNLSIGQGDSGAPLFDKDSHLLGMITFRGKNNSGIVEQNYAYAIPFTRINSIYRRTFESFI